MKILQTNWQGEYRSLGAYLDAQGIIFKHPCPYTYQQNRRVERKHRHIMELGLILLFQASIPINY